MHIVLKKRFDFRSDKNKELEMHTLLSMEMSLVADFYKNYE